MAGITDTSERVVSIFGYPRSGNTFLQTALKHIYPQHIFNAPRHTVWEVKQDIAKGNTPIIPFRNPLDAIGSWAIYRQEGHLGGTHFDWHNDTIEGDIKFYIRFYNDIIYLKDKFIFMDFIKFNNNLDYIKNKTNCLNLGKDANPTIDEIKFDMTMSIKKINLPRETKPIIEAIKPQIQAHPLFADTLSLYQILQDLEKEY